MDLHPVKFAGYPVADRGSLGLCVVPLRRSTVGCQDARVVVKSFRAEVRLDGEQWILLVPDLGNLNEGGGSLIEAEEKLRVLIASKFGVGADDICLELEDRRGIERERIRRTIPAELSHSAIRT